MAYVLAAEEISEVETYCLSSAVIAAAFFLIFGMRTRYRIGRQ